jgi:hypothetical protein
MEPAALKSLAASGVRPLSAGALEEPSPAVEVVEAPQSRRSRRFGR